MVNSVVVVRTSDVWKLSFAFLQFDFIYAAARGFNRELFTKDKFFPIRVQVFTPPSLFR